MQRERERVSHPSNTKHDPCRFVASSSQMTISRSLELILVSNEQKTTTFWLHTIPWLFMLDEQELTYIHLYAIILSLQEVGYTQSCLKCYTVLGIQHHIRKSVTYPISRCILYYTNDQQLQHNCPLMTLGVQQLRLLISWHEYVQQCHEVHAYGTQMRYNGTNIKCQPNMVCCSL